MKTEVLEANASICDRPRRNMGETRSSYGLNITALLILALTLVATTVIVQPQREFLSQDDGWAYARTLKTLLETGRYRLDQWSAANMPVQIYIAAALAKIFGFSLSLLRWPTIVLFAVGAVSFNALLLELRLRSEDALVLTLGLMASPVLLMLAFTFMSDIQFLGWLMLALWLSVRSIVNRSPLFAVLGSLAAAAAIGTRQFGVAIFGGWALVWLLSARQSRPPFTHMLLGLSVPVAATIFQLTRSEDLNATQTYRISEQLVFLSHSYMALGRELIWRLGVSMQYVSLFLLPLLPLTLGSAWLALRRAPSPRVLMASAIGCLAFGALVLTLDSSLTVRPQPFSPYGWFNLSIIWVLPTVLWPHPDLQQWLAFVGLAAVLPIAMVLLSSRAGARRWIPNRPELLLLGGTGTTLFLLQLAYVQFNDTYFVVLVAFALLWLGVKIGGLAPSPALLRSSLAVSIACIILTALWMRQDYDLQEVGWRAADQAVADGWSAEQIRGAKHWREYHGAFDDWLKAGSPGLKPPPARLTIGQDPFHDPFYKWLAERSKAGN